jgi:hypothetical protein
MKRIFISFLLIALAGGMAAQTVNISGQYVDKLENPIADAFVRFYRGGDVPTDSTYTDASGNFLLSFSLTGMDAPPQKPFLENPRPNPFTGHSSFVIQTDGPATLFVHTVSGLHVDKLSLPQSGTYACSWGGRNRIGQAMPAGTYVITVAGTGFNTSRKVVFEGRADRRLSAEKTGEQSSLKSLLTQDLIRFTKQNTSEHELWINQVFADTTLGAVTGNVGPEMLSTLVVNAHIDSLGLWNLNTHFYNDDQSIYAVDDTQNFAIVNDSLLSFIGSQGGFYMPLITAADPADPALFASMTAEVSIYTDYNITVNGSYMDKTGQPIAQATVKYFEGGTLLLGQTTTNNFGGWSLTVSLSRGSFDELRFSKTHTSPLVLPFPPPGADTTFGVVTGNIGPSLLSAIVANVHLDSLEMWNLNERFHNDDQSIYTVDDTQNFAIVNDSLLSFIGSQSGFYEPEITATDPQDPLLTALMEAEVTVRNERHVSLSGEYRDKINDPIAGAQLSYWEGGSTLLGQTATGSQGEWQMTVTLGFNRTTDELHFQKPNTSPLILNFPSPLADTTFGTVTGNIGPTATGSIAETRFSIEGTLEWNLNNYFHNDDQSIYTLTGSDFGIASQHWLQLPAPAPGSYNTGITATDPQDATLTAQTTAAVDVEYTIDLTGAFSIPEDAPAGKLVADFSQFVNPACTYDFAYTLLSNSNPALITFNIQGAQLLAGSLQPDGHGLSAVSVKMENLSGSGADTLWFDVNVLPMTDVYGIVSDILDSNLIAGATVYIFIADHNPNIIDTVAVLTTDASGAFHFQFEENPDTLTYFFVRIEKYGSTRGEGGYAPYRSWLGVNTKDADTEYSVALIPDELAEAYRPRKATAPRNSGDYTPRHTWLTVNPGGMDVEINYTIVPLSYAWGLYNGAFRDTTSTAGGFPFDKRITTHHWVSPPLMHLYNDTTYVPGYNINVQFANLVYNVENILPTFNPRDALPENTVIHQSFGHMLQDNELGAFFDDSIPGAGQVTRIYAGPRMNKCVTKYRSFVGQIGPDTSTFNQELGSCFGAVLEPPQSPNYISVFTDPAGSSSYTSYDFEMAKLYLDRNKIHYRNLTYDLSNSDGWDWEARPDIVEEWYTPTAQVVNTHMEIIVYGLEGEVTERTIYAYDSIPSEVMGRNPMLFNAEQIAVQRIREAAGLNTQPLYLWRKGEGVVVDCGCE